MSSVTRPRGPLPARVYWTRRAAMAGVALLLVVGLAKVLGGGGDGKDDTPAARIVSGPQSTQAPSTTTPDTKASKKKRQQQRKPKPPPLPLPSGPCTDSDVVVTPSIKQAHAGAPVNITLLVTSTVSPACTFEVSRQSVVLKLTSGDDKIWSSQQCQRAIPTTTVIARQQVPGRVDLTWAGRRSNEGCTSAAAWALPGYYHAVAAALGAEATDVQFFLGPAQRETITPEPRIKKPRRG